MRLNANNISPERYVRRLSASLTELRHMPFYYMNTKSHYIMKHSLYLICCLLYLTIQDIHAQNTFEEYKKKREQDFNNYRNTKQKEFEEYRQKKNAEFAKYVAKKWEAFQAMKGSKPATYPKPVDPVVIPDTPDKQPEVTKIPIKDVIPAKPTPIQKSPVKLPPIQKNTPGQSKSKIIFLGTPCYITMDKQLKFTMDGTSEKEVSKIYEKLSASEYDAFLDDCAQVYQNLKLNGWAAFLFCRTVSEQLLGKGNEATLLQTYLLAQFGYDARLCSHGQKLYMLATTTEDVTRYYYINLNNKHYYLWDLTYQGEQVHTFRENMKDAIRPIDFDNPAEMQLTYDATPLRNITSKAYPGVKATAKVNKNLIEYYSQMPIFAGKPWDIYARQALETPCYRELIPQLQTAIQGKNETDAANMLLNWVQTGFEYKTDNEQFGFEKPFFKEEVIFYPYCDCEDRSILFSYLIKQLLHLDVVLLYYPGHLATAVRFNGNVNGDYILLDNKKYIICDPTYIGAEIGRSMPQYKTSSFDVLKTL